MPSLASPKSPQTTPTPLGHRPALDGLRGVAILAVLGTNADWRFLQGGFFGVDLFFVLSGFLITTLLLDEQRATGTIDLVRFFKRRALRLMPALSALLLASCFFSLLHRPPEARAAAFALILSSFFYVTNWVIGLGHVHGTLEHLWSLSVEGQFYLLWGFALTLSLSRGVRLRRMLIVLAALFVAVGIWRALLWSHTHDVSRCYMGLDTRADSLLAGCIVALLFSLRASNARSPCPNTMPRWIVVGAWLVLCLGFVFFQEDTAPSYLGGFSAMALASALILLDAVETRGLFCRVLAFSPLRWFGNISYSIYLWHVPLKNIFSSERLAPRLHYPLAVESFRLLSFVCAGCASYFLIERPFLRLKHRFHGQPTKARP